MKPIIILPPKTMSPEDIKLLRENDLCVVVAKDPSKVKFVDPIPSAVQRTKIESAAISLSRKLLNRDAFIRNGNWVSHGRDDVARMYVELLVQGTVLDPEGSQEDQEKHMFDQAKWDEIQKLAREEARAERAAKKAKDAEKGATK